MKQVKDLNKQEISDIVKAKTSGCCKSTKFGWMCTRTNGHEGDHIGTTFNDIVCREIICHRWPQEGKPLGTIRRSLQVWFSPQQLLDLGTLIVAVSDNDFMKHRLIKEYGFTPNSLNELALKLNAEIKRLG